MARNTRWWRSAVAAGASVGILGALLGVLDLAPSAQAGASPPTYTWPQFHNGSSLPGLSADPAISTANAAQLGVDWMSPVGSSLASPMVAWNATRQETLAYVGTTAGYFNAVDVATGHIVWSDNLGSSLISSPLVEGNYVWIAPTKGGRVYKLDSATGATVCSGPAGGSILSTPVIATPPGGSTTVYFAAQGAGPTDGQVYAFAEADCSRTFAWNGYTQKGLDTGVWSPLAYGVDATGEGLLVFGSANPDSSVYAIDAVTGALVWTYQTYDPDDEDWDVGAGVDITAPGVNGFTDGAAYVEGKSGIFYALDLTTGALYWQNNFGGNGPGQPPVVTDALSTPAITGTTLIFGDINGVYALNALTGVTEWFYAGKQDVNSSPAVVGPVGSQVVAFGTLGNEVDVLDVATGTELYAYTTGASITSSPADVDGSLLIDSEDGYLYDFSVGGGNGSAPTTTVTAPAGGSVVANPNGPLTITGTASAPDGVGAVTVEVQEGGSTGPWFDQGADTFGSGLSDAQATLGSPGADTTSWSMTIPVPSQGGTYKVLASAVGTNGVADISALDGGTTGSSASFTVSPSADVPQLTGSSARVAPGSSLTVTGTGFGADEQVTFTLPVSASTTATVATGTTTGTGTVTVVAHVPTTAGFGLDTITATGATSLRTGLLSVYVANNDTQFGYGPLHDGFEANDPVINRSQATSNTGLLQLAWTRPTGGPVDSTPAVVRGTVFVGDESGAFMAVNEVTGALKWTTQVGGSIESSPAVDAQKVFFGDDNGSLTALDTNTGATVWTTPLGAAITSSPAVAKGMVYVGTSAGSLVAVNETTGAVAWRHTTPGAIVSSPAVDVAAGLVIATDQHGVVSAVSLSGAPVWRHGAGSAIDGSPTVAEGLVFVDTTGGTVMALTETTGAPKWSHALADPMTAAPALLGTTLVVGSQGGNLYHFNSVTGAQAKTQPVGAAVSGIALSEGIAVVTSGSGTVDALREPSGVRVAWTYPAAGAVASAPVILNGDLYVGDGASQLLAFSALGAPMV